MNRVSRDRAATRAMFLTCALLAAIVITASAFTQKSLTSYGGFGWDGAQYAKMTSQCWHEPISALEPFVYRFGEPCLAALIPASPKTALLLVNLASGVLLLFLLAVWLLRFVPPHIVPWLIACFAFHWIAPLRYSFWYPAYIDPLSICAITAALILSERPVLLSIACVIGVLGRETALVVPFSLLVGRLLTATRWGHAFSWRRIAADARVRGAMLAAVASLVAFAFTHRAVHPATDYWIADSAIVWFYSKPAPVYVLAWFLAFGPMLAIPLARWSTTWRFLTDTPEYLILLLAGGVLGWIGGTDTERFLVWGAPIVLVTVGVAAAEIDWRQAQARTAFAILAVGHALNGRWFMLTPIDTVEGARVRPFLTAFGAHQFADLMSKIPDQMVSAKLLGEYGALALVLVMLLRPRPAAEQLQAEDVVA